MPLKCENPEILLKFIAEKYHVISTNPSGLGEKFDFPNGLVVNVFKTGTVNFQNGNNGPQTVQDITTLVEIINR